MPRVIISRLGARLFRANDLASPEELLPYQRHVDREDADLQDRCQFLRVSDVVEVARYSRPGAPFDPIGNSTKLMIGRVSTSL